METDQITNDQIVERASFPKTPALIGMLAVLLIGAGIGVKKYRDEEYLAGYRYCSQARTYINEAYPNDPDAESSPYLAEYSTAAEARIGDLRKSAEASWPFSQASKGCLDSLNNRQPRVRR